MKNIYKVSPYKHYLELLPASCKVVSDSNEYEKKAWKVIKSSIKPQCCLSILPIVGKQTFKYLFSLFLCVCICSFHFESCVTYLFWKLRNLMLYANTKRNKATKAI